MNILLFLIPISLLLVLAAMLAFAWALRGGQFEDLDTPALDVLVGEERLRTAQTYKKPPDAP